MGIEGKKEGNAEKKNETDILHLISTRVNVT